MLSPVAGLGTFLVSCTEAAERAREVRPKTNEAIRKARRSCPGIGGMPIMYVEPGTEQKRVYQEDLFGSEDEDVDVDVDLQSWLLLFGNCHHIEFHSEKEKASLPS
jgi:hypothetical protein